MDDKTRQAIALKRFSVISPNISGNVKNNTEYFQELAKAPLNMPTIVCGLNTTKAPKVGLMITTDMV
ncbi:MAG: hypothetical protein ACOX4U_08275 [Anaerovoracaceae bacterium]|jgi:hypothetical protein